VTFEPAEGVHTETLEIIPTLAAVDPLRLFFPIRRNIQIAGNDE
jgi:hypothetical protein